MMLAMYTPRGYTLCMSSKIENRLKRLIGQLQKIENEVASNGVCHDVIPQFLAVKGALNAAFLEYVKESIAECKKSDKQTMDTLLTHLIKS